MCLLLSINFVVVVNFKMCEIRKFQDKVKRQLKRKKKQKKLNKFIRIKHRPKYKQWRKIKYKT